MSTVEIRNAMKNAAAQKFIDTHPDCMASVEGDYVFIDPTPVEVDGKPTYVKWTLTACQWADTKARSKFNPETDCVDAQTTLDGLIEEQVAAKKSSEEKKKSKAKKKKNEEEE